MFGRLSVLAKAFWVVFHRKWKCSEFYRRGGLLVKVSWAGFHRKRGVFRAVGRGRCPGDEFWLAAVFLWVNLCLG